MEHRFTGKLGVSNQVAIDYTDIKFEGQYALSELLDLTFYVRSYNKTSDNSSFDYSDATAGTGFKIRY